MFVVHKRGQAAQSRLAPVYQRTTCTRTATAQASRGHEAMALRCGAELQQWCALLSVILASQVVVSVVHTTVLCSTLCVARTPMPAFPVCWSAA